MCRLWHRSKLAAAAAGPSPPKCCASWTRAFARTPVVKVSQKTPPRRRAHWFSRWAAQAPPPLRAQAISFTHVINPFVPNEENVEHPRAQLTTLESVSHAQGLARAQGVSVEVTCRAAHGALPHPCTFH